MFKNNIWWTYGWEIFVFFVLPLSLFIIALAIKVTFNIKKISLSRNSLRRDIFVLFKNALALRSQIYKTLMIILLITLFAVTLIYS